MNDFETHPLGTRDEIRLSRDLARAVEIAMDNPDCKLPVEVVIAYKRLYGQYIRQIQSEE